jgi:hypothetical protein
VTENNIEDNKSNELKRITTMKKTYMRPHTDIENMEPESLMDFGMSGNGDGTGLEPQSREGNGQLWDDENGER